MWYNIPMEKKQDSVTSNPEMVTISRAEYEVFLGQRQQLLTQNEHIAELEQKVDILMGALRLARQKKFGASSEKMSEDAMEQLSFLFNEAEVYAEAKTEEEPVVVAAHKRNKKHEYTLDNLPDNIPTEVVEHRLEGEKLVCPECGDTMTEIGKEVVKKMKIISAKVVVEEHHYYAYACQTCNKENIETPVVKAPREKNPGKRTSSPAALPHRRPLRTS